MSLAWFADYFHRSAESLRSLSTRARSCHRYSRSSTCQWPSPERGPGRVFTRAPFSRPFSEPITTPASLDFSLSRMDTLIGQQNE